MARFELTMTARYALSWGIREGVREIVQNMLDGHDDGYPMEIGWTNYAGQEYLSLSNKGLVLDRSAWLLGKSNKGPDARGRHGDGLKVGSLALVRRGVALHILNGDERWTPSLEYSETFAGEIVMAIQTRRGSARQHDFTVLLGISRADWETYRQDFLPLSNIDATTIRNGGYVGNMIMDPAAKGKIFVKGIWVCDKASLAYGYDLHEVTLDRDRRILDTWDVQYAASQIQTRIAQDDKAMVGQIFQDLVKGVEDVEHVHFHSANIQDSLAEMFKAEYGDKAIAVSSAADATRVEHYGLKGVVVPKGLREVMENVIGKTDDVICKAMDTCGVYLTDDELDDEERKAWSLAKGILTLTGVELDPATVRVYDFRVPDAPLGTYTDGEIRINRSVLRDGAQAVVTLAHEVAHRNGRDGTLDHRAAEERILKNVIGALLGLVDTNWISA